MEIVEFFLKFALVLVSAKAMAEVFARAGLPGVIGEVLAGVVVGPSVFGVIGQEPTFLLLANIGAIFLLFHVGLETDVGMLLSVGGQASLVAVTGVLLPFAAAFAACYYLFGMPGTASAFAAGTLVATSIGITLRVLKDLGRGRGAVAQVVLGAAVLDDIIGVAVLAVLMEFVEAGRVEVLSSLKVMGLIVLVLALAPALGPVLRRALEWLDRFSKTSGAVSTTVVAFMLAMSALTHSFGAPEIIGAFAAGLALTGSPAAFRGGGRKHGPPEMRIKEVERDLAPIGELFMPFFFVMVGVSMDLRLVDFSSGRFWSFAGILTAIAVLTKLASGVWAKGPPERKLAVGMAMVPRGEVGLVFAQAGLARGVFDLPAYAAVVFVVALTTLLGPVLLKPLMGKKEP